MRPGAGAYNGRNMPALAALAPAWTAAVAALALAHLPGLAREAAELFGRGSYTPSLSGLAANGGDALRTLTAAAATAGPAWLAGHLIWPWLAPGAGRFRLHAALPVGAGAVGFALYGLLLTGLWFPGLLWALPAALVAARRRAVAELIGAVLRRRPPASGGARTAVWVTLAAGLPWMLCPETHDDAWVYHLAAPERWLALHGLSVRGVEPRCHLPMLADLVHVYPLLLGADAACRWTHLLAFLSGAGALCSVLPGPGSGWSLLTVLLALPATVLLTAKSDGTAAGLVLLAGSVALRRPGTEGATVASGAVAGLALAAKLTSAMNLTWIPLALPAGRLLAAPRRLAGWGAAALAVWAPWGAKSWLLTGDPAYFLLAGPFPALVDGWDARHAETWRRWRDVRPWTPGRPAALLAEVVWSAPLFAACLPVALARGVPHRRLVAAAAGCYAAWGALTHNQHFHRLAFPGLAAAMLAAGAAIPSTGRRWPWIGVAAVAAAVRLATQVPQAGWYANPASFLLGAETRAAQVALAMTRLDEVRIALAAAPRGRTMLVAGEQRVYRLPQPVRIAIANSGSETPLLWRMARASPDAEGIRKRWRQENADRLLYNPVRGHSSGGVQRAFDWDDRMLGVWGDFLARWLDLEIRPARVDLRHGTCYVWRLRARPRRAGAGGPLLFLPGAEPLLAPVIDASWRDLPPAGVAAFEAILRRVPGIAAYETGQAYLLRALGRWEEAYRLYRPGIRAGLLMDEHLGGFAVVALMTGREAEAAGAFDRAAEAYPDRTALMRDWAARARFLLAARVAEGDPARAERIAREGLAGLAGVPAGEAAGALHAVAALALAHLGRGADAAAALRRAAAAQPRLRGVTIPGLPALVAMLAGEMVGRPAR